jgi:predicted AAA+ superfamily ATPase
MMYHGQAMTSTHSANTDDGERYRPRVIDGRLERYLRVFGAVLVEGPKWCGKTWTGRHHSRSNAAIDDQATRNKAMLDPNTVLAGNRPRLIDEWQDAPVLWNTARRIVDDSPDKGLFIFTGSAVPPSDPTRHTGTGRFARLRMRPMSLFEAGQSSGDVSLASLFAGGPIAPAPSNLDYAGVIRMICRGGWPVGLGLPDDDALLIPREYIGAVVESDVSRVDGVARDPRRVSAVLRSLARNNASAAKLVTIQADTAAHSRGDEVSLSSVRHYVNALERIFIVENLPSWIYALGSKSQLRLTPKRHFVDPSLAVAALGATPHAVEADPNTAGFLFESLCVRDLRVYAEASGWALSHYRDNKGLEADAIVEGDNGSWGAVEVKLGMHQADEAAKTLRRLRDKLKDQVSKPSFLMILTATGGIAHTRDDGVHVVPLDCLGP